VAHGVTTFFLPEMELLVETLDCSQRIIHFAFNGNPELVLLFPQFQRHIIQHLGKFIQDLQGNMPVGSRNLGLGEHPIGGIKPRTLMGGNKDWPGF